LEAPGYPPTYGMSVGWSASQEDVLQREYLLRKTV